MYTFCLVRPDGSVWLQVTVQAGGVTSAARCIPRSDGLDIVLV